MKTRNLKDEIEVVLIDQIVAIAESDEISPASAAQ
jgi:hypothetical protein